MSGKAYHFGDTYPPDENGYRKPKTEDAANFGLFKNNWGTIRASCSQFKGQKASDWRNGAVLNINETAAIICQHEQIEALGEGSFYEKQRGVPGQGGSYGNAVGFIKNYLNQGHLKDNLVTYYNLGAV
ncbi:MAG: hypothetical protein LQ342_006178 [Letrouitia transgressa]|nr:MAG: hypothetical protein LQ342_006178 [Letrouitia transgressa]